MPDQAGFVANLHLEDHLFLDPTPGDGVIRIGSGDWNWGSLPCDPKKDLDWPMWLGSRFGLAPERAYDPERYSRFRKYWDYSGGLATDLLYHVYALSLIHISEPTRPY